MDVLAKMFMKLIFIQFLLIFLSAISLRAGQYPDICRSETIVGSHLHVTGGKYELDIYDGKPVQLATDEPVIFAMYNGKIAVKTRNSQSFMCDSLIVRGLTGNDKFSFRVNGGSSIPEFLWR